MSDLSSRHSSYGRAGSRSSTGRSDPNRQMGMTQRDIDAWNQAWAENMLHYWRERMQRVGVIPDTGELQRSLQYKVTTGQITNIEHRFAMYGIYVSRGSSPAFSWELWGHNKPKTPRERGTGMLATNAGQLEFLEPGYRREHGLDQKKRVGPAWGGRLAGGEPIGARDWWAKKYAYSLFRLNETNAAEYGELYQGYLLTAFEIAVNGARYDAPIALHSFKQK